MVTHDGLGPAASFVDRINRVIDRRSGHLVLGTITTRTPSYADDICSGLLEYMSDGQPLRQTRKAPVIGRAGFSHFLLLL